MDQITKVVKVCVGEHTKEPAANYNPGGLDSVHSQGDSKVSKVGMVRGGVEFVNVHQVANVDAYVS